VKVVLIATNIELQPLREAVARGTIDGVQLSPESIAAAYARISRSSHSVERLRREARLDVVKARQSNERIVFEMGHSSIAEHAVFNFDIEGVSRLALEELERSRLASYTERSQRYVMIGRDFFLPPEMQSVPGFAGRMTKLVDSLSETYRLLYQSIVGSVAAARKAGEMAREDARYALPLCTTGQVGLTINARSLEDTVRRMAGSRLSEVRNLARRLEEEALKVTPSLVRYTEAVPAPFEADGVTASGSSEVLRVRLLDSTPDGEAKLAETLAWMTGRAAVSPEELEHLIAGYYVPGSPHLRAPRLFELVDFTFDVRVSATCFAQLKRHRMATILAGPYDLGLGVMVPPTVARAGVESDYLAACRDAEGVAREWLGYAPDQAAVAAYCLTNGHQRRVRVKMNLRELYHFSRLRLDQHAQWEIRLLAQDMCGLARREFPRACAFLCGKHEYGDWCSGR
jgi:flavin-dependent thymidylate synthase